MNCHWRRAMPDGGTEGTGFLPFCPKTELLLTVATGIPGPVGNGLVERLGFDFPVRWCRADVPGRRPAAVCEDGGAAAVAQQFIGDRAEPRGATRPARPEHDQPGP